MIWALSDHGDGGAIWKVAVQSCALQGIPESGLNDLTYTSTSTEVAGYDLVKFTLGPDFKPYVCEPKFTQP